MRSLLLLALCVLVVSSKTIVWVSSNSPYRVVATWDPALVSDSKLLPLLNAFFYAYPKMTSKYNPKAAQNLTWTFDPTYKGVAASSGTTTWFSTDYFGSRSDAGVAVHESMHIVQAYPSFPNAAGWLTEGIADYVRDEFSLNGYNYNSDSQWSLPKYSSGQSYTQGYGVTASFLKYLEKTYPDKKVVLNLDAAMRSAKYTVNTWQSITGKTLNQLWAQYVSASTAGKRRRRSIEVVEQPESEEIRVIEEQQINQESEEIQVIEVPTNENRRRRSIEVVEQPESEEIRVIEEQKINQESEEIQVIEVPTNEKRRRRSVKIVNQSKVKVIASTTPKNEEIQVIEEPNN